MKPKTSVGVVIALVTFLMTSAVGVTQASTPTLVADWEMNESPGTTVMVDTTGSHPGIVNPAGVTANGSSYHWQQRCPSCLPTAIERVVVELQPRARDPRPLSYLHTRVSVSHAGWIREHHAEGPIRDGRGADQGPASAGSPPVSVQRSERAARRVRVTGPDQRWQLAHDHVCALRYASTHLRRWCPDGRKERFDRTDR